MKKKSFVAALFAFMLTFILGACGSNSDASLEGTVTQSTIANVKDKGTLVVGTAPGYMPFEMMSVDNEFVGYDIDMAQAIADNLGVELEVQQFDFSALIPALNTGNIDMILAGMTITGERAQSVSFSNPYYSTGQVLMLPASDTTTETWEDLDVEGNIIAVSQGTTGAMLAHQLFQNAEVADYTGFSEVAMAISQGKAQGTVYDEPPVQQYEIMNPDSVRGVYNKISSENLGVAVKYNDLETVQWLNAFLQGYKESPEDLASVEYWFNSTDWMQNVETEE